MPGRLVIVVTTLFVSVILVSSALAQEAPPAQPAHDVTELAKATQNPVGDLISVPFQFNFNHRRRSRGSHLLQSQLPAGDSVQGVG